MGKIISKIAGAFATLGVLLIVVSNFFSESGYVFFWIGIVVLIISGIAYLVTGEKIKKWFWDILEIL